MLKLAFFAVIAAVGYPAAFRRLCVETFYAITQGASVLPAAFRRLCVETFIRLIRVMWGIHQPPSGGCVLKQTLRLQILFRLSPAAFRRLCVETQERQVEPLRASPAAFRRLCVETHASGGIAPSLSQPPSGGCVLKP